MKPLLDVLQGKSPSRRPVWLMRQAGRYLPEYREVRRKAGSFLDLCYSPDLAAEVTLQPLRRFDLDAAILFSDILVVPQAMGLGLDFIENEGPRLETVSDSGGVTRLDARNAAANLGKVYETVALVRRELSEGIGLIGFCGGAWTVASYMIEGGSSDRKQALAVAVRGEAWFGDLMEKVIEVSVDYLCRQVEAGAEALQIFDSWAGDVPAELRESVVFAPSRKIIDAVRARHRDVPVILFARGLGEGHVDAARYCAPNGMGVEQGVSLNELSALLGEGIAVQGNLEPEKLLAGEKEFRVAVRAVLENAPKNRHIFNLGHGILPSVSPERVTELVRLIREHDGV
jgi:uroporphyrinogen decarboxylase